MLLAHSGHTNSPTDRPMRERTPRFFIFPRLLLTVVALHGSLPMWLENLLSPLPHQCYLCISSKGTTYRRRPKCRKKNLAQIAPLLNDYLSNLGFYSTPDQLVRNCPHYLMLHIESLLVCEDVSDR